MRLILNKNAWLFLPASRQKNMHGFVPLCMKQHDEFILFSFLQWDDDLRIWIWSPGAAAHQLPAAPQGGGGGDWGGSFQELPMFLFSLCPGYFQQNYQIVGASWVLSPEIQNQPSLGLCFLSPITIKLSSSTWARGHCGTNSWLVFHRCLGLYDLNPISSRENKVILTCGNWLCPHGRCLGW